MNKYEDRINDTELPEFRLPSNENKVVPTPYILGDIEDLDELPPLLGPKTYTKAKLTREEIVEKITSNPKKTNVAWGKEWDCSRERVRQLREQFGLNSVREFNLEIFNLALEAIAKGSGMINANTFKNIPNFSVIKFNTWLEEKPYLKQQVELVRKEAYDKIYNPTSKLCPFCDKTLPIDNFYVSKSGRDRRMNKCNDCNIRIVKHYYDKRYVPNPTVTEKVCTSLKDLGPLPASFFHKSTKATSGLQYNSIRYQETYAKWKSKYKKIMKIEDDNTRNNELSFLGNWKENAKNEARELIRKDLEEYNMLNLE